jgi:hypothetical protein
MKRSKNTEFMMQAITSDFRVEQVEEDEDWVLFAAERKDLGVRRRSGGQAARDSQ